MLGASYGPWIPKKGIRDPRQTLQFRGMPMRLEVGLEARFRAQKPEAVPQRARVDSGHFSFYSFILFFLFNFYLKNRKILS